MVATTVRQWVDVVGQILSASIEGTRVGREREDHRLLVLLNVGESSHHNAGEARSLMAVVHGHCR